MPYLLYIQKRTTARIQLTLLLWWQKQ